MTNRIRHLTNVAQINYVYFNERDKMCAASKQISCTLYYEKDYVYDLDFVIEQVRKHADRYNEQILVSDHLIKSTENGIVRIETDGIILETNKTSVSVIDRADELDYRIELDLVPDLESSGIQCYIDLKDASTEQQLLDAYGLPVSYFMLRNGMLQGRRSIVATCNLDDTIRLAASVNGSIFARMVDYDLVYSAKSINTAIRVKKDNFAQYFRLMNTDETVTHSAIAGVIHIMNDDQLTMLSDGARNQVEILTAKET